MFTAHSTLTPRNSTYPYIDPARHANRLKGKTALITGAGRGIGRATALALAAAGARVVLTARRQADIDAVAQEVTSSSNPNQAIGVAADVCSPTAPSSVLSEIHNRWGPDANIDIFVACAGMTRFQLFSDEPGPELEDWWRVLEVNVRGTVSFIRAVLPGMLSRKSGTIISLASTSGSQDIPFNSAYAASKAAIIKFNQDLGVELEGTGVNCFALHPGSIPTDLGANEGAVNMESVGKSEGMQKVLGAFNEMEKQTVDLPANTSVALCVEEDAKAMRGRYVDSQYDLWEVLKEAKKGPGGKIEKERSYWLKLDEI
ncbi:MAG: hypothetical protein Q9216_000500 [Gyalolechia sp. 2 TL-2023]